jgi:hypothetical protein
MAMILPHKRPLSGLADDPPKKNVGDVLTMPISPNCFQHFCPWKMSVVLAGVITLQLSNSKKIIR